MQDDPRGKLYCLNVYTNDFPDRSWMSPGTVKTLRVLEGVPRRTENCGGLGPFGNRARGRGRLPIRAAPTRPTAITG